MDLPVVPPVEPMLARLARRLPAGPDLVYEPKWDGFRCLAFRSGAEIDLRSRNHRPLSRYFPELIEAFGSLEPGRFVLDGEILVTGERGFDFAALLQRLHPAPSRVDRLRRETPASYVAFDLLALGAESLLGQPFHERRRRLEELVGGAGPPLSVTPVTADEEQAGGWLDRFRGGGIDGVVAKDRRSPYQPGRRAMVKVKHEATTDCVVGGFRWHLEEPTVSSLLLGLYDEGGALHHIGLAACFSATRRRELLEEVAPLATSLAGHPWEHGFPAGGGPVGRLPGVASRWAYGEELTWVPLRPELVCEVAHDPPDGYRFRHAARFRRWRPDRDPRSCTLDQLDRPPAADVLEMLVP
jgi:ATP-dependent DNA ligase